MPNQNFINEMKQKLLDSRSQLQEELNGLSAHTEMGDRDEDNAEEVPLDEANQSIMARIKSDLEKIDKALVKIENGSYGTDDQGKEISEARLRVMPWADKAI